MRSAPTRRNLTQRQNRFVVEYLQDLNATQAAIRAGYSARSAGKIGPRLVGESRIAAAIAASQAQRLKRADLTSERVLEEIRRLALSNIIDVLDDKGRLVNLKALPEGVQACISEIRFGADGVAKSVKFWPKPQALHLAATHLRLLVELSEQKTSLEIRIREMTPDQRKQYALELLDKARNMLPGHINIGEAELEVVENAGGMGAEDGAEPLEEGDGAA